MWSSFGWPTMRNFSEGPGLNNEPFQKIQREMTYFPNLIRKKWQLVLNYPKIVAYAVKILKFLVRIISEHRFWTPFWTAGPCPPVHATPDPPPVGYALVVNVWLLKLTLKGIWRRRFNSGWGNLFCLMFSCFLVFWENRCSTLSFISYFVSESR